MAGYAMQANKGFNPFLMDADPVPSQPIASNPFLDFSSPATNENEGAGANPFLSYAAAPPPADGGNPFAQFISPAPLTENSWGVREVTASPFYGTDYEQLETAPAVPRSTQDLLQTVTGSLEAASDSLMDRLRLSQPSPVPMPPSPTPSPRSPSPDLWGEEETASDHHHINPHTSHEEPVNTLLDLYESAPTNSGPKSSIEILGLYSTCTTTSTTTTLPFANPASIQLIDNDIQDVPGFAASETLQEPMRGSAGFANTQPIVLETMEPTYAPPVEKPVFNQAVEPDLNFNQQIVEPEFVEPYVEPAKVEPYVAPAKVASCIAPAKVTEPEVQKPIFESPFSSPAAEPERLKTFVQPEPAPIPVSHAGPPVFVPVNDDERPVPTPSLPPERPKPPPVPPISQRKPLPNRPPPPMPPAPRIQHPPPPPILEQIANPFQDTPAFPIIITPKQEPPVVPAAPADFDSFDAKFNSLVEPALDSATKSPSPFEAYVDSAAVNTSSTSAWGDAEDNFGDSGKGSGFGTDDGFDSFLALTEPPPVPQSTPAKCRVEGRDYDEFERDDPSFKIVIRNKERPSGELSLELAPALAPPPPKSPAISTGSAFSEESTSFVPFLSAKDDSAYAGAMASTQLNRTDSSETPQTPLFEEDQSQPLEDFPRIKYLGEGWDMHMRHPNKKKITGQRFWKKVFVRIASVNEAQTVQIYANKGDKDPFQEFPLQPSYSVSDIAAQQFDQFGKIFTMKLQYVFYKERPGIRPGQITKAERITNKLSQFAAYAIQGDYQGVKEFGSDLKKLGMPLEHAPQISQLVKLGTQNYEEMKQFSACIEEALFRVAVHRERAGNYKSEEVQVTLVDEYYVEQDIYGVVLRQIARVRLYFLSFLSGAAEVELGINDIRRQGKEVVGRHDIIPIATEEWIRTEDIEFSNCVQLDVFEDTKMVKFKPPDACYIELLRFRVRPPRHRELPMQVKTVFTTTGKRIEMRCDILVPGFTSRKLGQIPCEDVMVRIPIPECWIYMFRVEKHFRYGSVKSAHRRSGKVKGIERFLGAVEAVEQSLMEVTSGQAKYEHQHRSIVWRIARLPKEGQGAYTTHSFVCHITLQPHEEIPENLTKHCYIEFTMPHTTISHTVCRSVSVPMCDEPPEKCVRYLSRHEYTVEIDHTHGVTPATYNLAATVVKEEPKIVEEPEPEPAMPGKALSDSDFSDDD